MPTIRYHKIDYNHVAYPQLFRLRYQVYCQECGFEDPLDYPDRMEQDEYDPYAIHFCNSLDDTSELIGTVRMILHSGIGFPLEKNFIIDETLLPDFDRTRVAEISRLAISKRFRRRATDKLIYSEQKPGFNRQNGVFETERRHKDRNIALGLYYCIYRESLRLGLTHWYAAMTDGLCHLLTSKGCIWHPIGPSIYYHGYRRPYIASIAENAAAARKNFGLGMKTPDLEAGHARISVQPLGKR